MAKKKKGKKSKRNLKKKQQNKLKRIRSKSQSKSKLLPKEQHLINRQSLAEMEAPDGFLPISMAQGIMEYAKPLMELSESIDIEDQNNVLQIAMTLWNYTISLEDGNDGHDLKMKILDAINSTFGMNDKETAKLFKKMVVRKNYLFPPEIQINLSMTMFMRKEVSNLITTFNYNKLNLSGATIPPDTKDKELVISIIKMDKFIIDKADYDDWEDHYFSMEDKCADRFNKWLIDKGLVEYSDDFPYWIQTYLSFIYNYMHDDVVLLKDVQPIYFEEFFADYVLRKVMVEPHEYVQFIPAIKSFHAFLYEKGYIDDPKPVIKILDAFEPIFIEILRKRFR